MGIRLDKFSWIVVVAVAILLIGAVVSVNISGNDGMALEYVTEDAPSTPVHNAFVAVQKGEFSQAREQYSDRVLEEMKTSGYDPFAGGSLDNTPRRMRVIEVTMNESDPDRATVSFALDTFYRNSGPFGSGSTYSREGVVELVREDGEWKIDTSEYFNY